MTDKGRKSPDYLTRNILTVIYFQASTGNKICSRLLQALDGVTDHGVSVLLDVLDLIAEIIVKQGRNLANLHPVAVERLFPYLEHDRQAVRKRAIQAIHKVSHSASSQIQSDLLSRVITSLTDSSRGTELQRTILQARVSALKVLKFDFCTPQFQRIFLQQFFDRHPTLSPCLPRNCPYSESSFAYF